MADKLQYSFDIGFNEESLHLELKKILKQLQEHNKLVLDVGLNMISYKTTLKTVTTQIVASELAGEHRN